SSDVCSSDLDSADAEAERCRAGRWWCTALRGFARHAASMPEADSIYLHALELAPAEVRCEWSDLTLLLHPRQQRRYRELPCGARRDSANVVIWWLAQPLHTRRENDRRAEHHARLTLAWLQEGSR